LAVRGQLGLLNDFFDPFILMKRGCLAKDSLFNLGAMATRIKGINQICTDQIRYNPPLSVSSACHCSHKKEAAF
jgi:hypothetical protein